MSSYLYCINKQRRIVGNCGCNAGHLWKHRSSIELSSRMCSAALFPVQHHHPPSSKCTVYNAWRAREEDVGLCWRLFTAVFLHSVSDQRQKTSRQKPWRGGDLRKILVYRKVLFQVTFKEEILHCLLWFLFLLRCWQYKYSAVDSLNAIKLC